MRKSSLKALELEEEESNQRQSRNNGLSLMSVRDRGWAKLSNGSVMEWSVDSPLQELVPRRQIPVGHFYLDGKLFDVDEFRKYERWV